MTDKEFQRLSRSQLVEIIYQLQLKLDDLNKENKALQEALDDRRLRLNETGNIAEAALEIHKVMQAAQDAALHYVEEVRIRTDADRKSILSEARQEAERILARAQAQEGRTYDPMIEAIIKEYR